MTSPLQEYYKPLPPPPEEREAPLPKPEPSMGYREPPPVLPPPKVYRDPEPPVEMRNTPPPVSSPVNPNVGMPGKALAIQREQAKKAMMNPSGTTASGRVKTGIPFDEASRAHGMQIPARPVTPPKPVAPPKQVITKQVIKTPPKPVAPPKPMVQKPVAIEPAKFIAKAGGQVKKMATGGMVKASRGDGIAQRGRTRGKIC